MENPGRKGTGPVRNATNAENMMSAKRMDEIPKTVQERIKMFGAGVKTGAIGHVARKDVGHYPEAETDTPIKRTITISAEAGQEAVSDIGKNETCTVLNL